jgi:hypothetical protein
MDSISVSAPPRTVCAPARSSPNGGQANFFFENPEVRKVIQNWMLDQVYDRVRQSSPAAAAAAKE